MKKRLIKMLVSLERAVSKLMTYFAIKWGRWNNILQRLKSCVGICLLGMWQSFLKIEKFLCERNFLMWESFLPVFNCCCCWDAIILRCPEMQEKKGSDLSRWQWQSLTWPCCSLFVFLNASEASTWSETCQNNKAVSCNSFSSVLMKIKGLTFWICLCLTN